VGVRVYNVKNYFYDPAALNVGSTWVSMGSEGRKKLQLYLFVPLYSVINVDSKVMYGL
jgi:hypothetical protein